MEVVLSTGPEKAKRSPQGYIDEWSFAPGSDGHDIAHLLWQWGGGPRWLDLGCGPMTPIWRLFNPLTEGKGVEITGADVQESALAYAMSGEMSQGHSRALRLASDVFGYQAVACQSPEMDRNLLFGHNFHYRPASVLDEQDDWIGAYDFVTQIGVFACLGDIGQFRQAVNIAARYLRPGGRFMGVNWLQRVWDQDATWNGEVSSQLTMGIVLDACQQAGLVMRLAKQQPTTDDRYTTKLMWIAEKRTLGRWMI